MREHSASFRWLMASLLTLNVGGLVAIINGSGAIGGLEILSLMLFYLGIASALCIAWIGQRFDRAIAAHLSELINNYTYSAITGESMAADIEVERKAMLDSHAKLGAWPARFGWISFVLFSAALLSLGIDAWVSGADEDHFQSEAEKQEIK